MEYLTLIPGGWDAIVTGMHHKILLKQVWDRLDVEPFEKKITFFLIFFFWMTPRGASKGAHEIVCNTSARGDLAFARDSLGIHVRQATFGEIFNPLYFGPF